MINLRYFYNRCIVCNYTSIDCIIRNYCINCHKSIEFNIIEEIDEEQHNNKADINILDLLRKI